MLDGETTEAVKQMRETDAIWILKDADGCVMLTTEDEDGVPIWSTRSQADAWANDDWSHCEAFAIDIHTWLQKWTTGLEQDHLAIMINPSEFQEQGVVVSPQEFAAALEK